MHKPVVSPIGPGVSPRHAILAGLCATLVGIGLARFDYTPLIPALIAERWFTPSAAAYLGAANLAGYIAGRCSVVRGRRDCRPPRSCGRCCCWRPPVSSPARSRLVLRLALSCRLKTFPTRSRAEDLSCRDHPSLRCSTAMRGRWSEPKPGSTRIAPTSKWDVLKM